MIKIQIGKRGKADGLKWIFGIFGVVAIISMISLMVYLFAPQTGVTETVKVEQQQQTQEVVDLIKTGKSALVKFQVYDISNANTNTLASAPIYMIRESGSFEIDGTGSKTSGTALSGSAVTGEKIKACAGNNTWGYVETIYNDKTYNCGEEIVVDKEDITVRINVIKNTIQGDIRTMDNGVANSNLSVSVDSSNSWDRLEIRNNGTSEGWLVQYVYVDKVVGSNLTANDGIVINGGLANLNDKSKKVGINLARNVGFTKIGNFKFQSSANQDLDDYIYAVSPDKNPSGNADGLIHNKPILLLAGDEIWSSTVTMKADGDGCVTNGVNDRPIFRVADGNIIRSAKNDVVYMWQPETDANSPADVGATNFASVRGGADGNYCI